MKIYLKKSNNAFFYKALFFCMALFIFSSCSENKVEPDQADLVKGSYSGVEYSESYNGISQSYDLTNVNYKDLLAFTFNVNKNSTNTINIEMVILQKDQNGQQNRTVENFMQVEIVKINEDMYELKYQGTKWGEINNGVLEYETEFDDVDNNGKTITVKVIIKAIIKV